MTNTCKTLGNLGASLLLLLLGVWLLLDDLRYPGEILFQSSVALVWLGVFVTIWFLSSHVFAIFPKRVVFPALFLLILRLSVGFPLNLVLSNKMACVLYSTALTSLAAGYFLGSLIRFRQFHERDWFGLRHSLVTFLTGLGATILAVPLGAGGMVAATQNVLGDYTRISLTSISMVERVFEKGGRKVFLIGMMHLGEEDFYARIRERMTGRVQGKRVVLSEGVSDEKDILPESFSSGRAYGRIARRFGLTVQDSENFRMSPREKEERDRMWQRKGVHFINADVDVSEFSHEHQKTLVAILNALGSDKWSEILMGPELVSGEEMEDLMMDGLLQFRNDRLMEHFRQVWGQEEVTEIYIPWGAAHLPDIEKRILALGFEKIREEKRPVVRFWRKHRGN